MNNEQRTNILRLIELMNTTWNASSEIAELMGRIQSETPEINFGSSLAFGDVVEEMIEDAENMLEAIGDPEISAAIEAGIGI